MKNTMDALLRDAVSRTGGRLTKQREELFKLLAVAHKPVTLQELISQSCANEVSVYRTIRFLREVDLVEEIVYPDGSKRYALGGHHHHIICRSCGFTAHLSCKGEQEVPSVGHIQFTKIDRHEITYYGVCTLCG